MATDSNARRRVLGCLIAPVLAVAAAGCGEEPDKPAPGAPTPKQPPPQTDKHGGDQTEGHGTEGEGATNGAAAGEEAAGEAGADQQAGNDGGPADEAEASGAAGSQLEDEAQRRHARAEYARVQRLKRSGHVAEALRRAQQLEQRYPQFQRELELTYQVRRLLQRRREAAPLKFALDKFAEYGSTQLDAAYTRFRRAGETGAFMLGRAVAERSDDIADKALTMLKELDATKVADACARRLRADPDTALRGRCLDLIAERPQTLSMMGVEALYDAAVSQKDRPDGVRLRRLTALRLEAGFDEAGMASLMLRALDARAGDSQEAGLVELIGAIYHFAAGRSDEAFAEMAGEAARLDEARSAAKASGAATEDAGAAPTKAGRLLTPVDLPGLDEGLAARWMFGTAKWPVLPGDAGRAVEGEAVAVGRERSSAIVADSYGIAAWVRPGALPSDNADQPFFVLARKAGWPMALLVAPDGAVVFMHATEGREAPIVCRSKTKLAPGVWSHVAASVDRAGGTVALAINGRREAEASFEAGAAVATDPDATRPYRALGLSPEGEAVETKFTGEVESLRLYERALDAATMKDLALIGRAWD